MTNAAAYCPTCGTPTGNLVLEPVLDDEGDVESEVALGGRPRRRWVAAVAVGAAVAVVAGVAVVSNRGGGTASPPATTTATTRPRGSTTAAPTTTTSAWSQIRTTPFVPDAQGLVVYVGNRLDQIVRIDLGAGVVERRVVSPNGRTGPWLVLARSEGAVIASLSGDEQSKVFGVGEGPGGAVRTIADWQPVGLGLVPPEIAAAAEPDQVWVWHRGDIHGTSIERTTMGGSVTAGPVTLPRLATVLGADGPGAVAIAGPDGLYRAAIAGPSVTVERVWPRVPVAYNVGWLLDLVCRDDLACHVELVNRATGTSRPVAVPPPSYFGYFTRTANLLSPDGRWLVNVPELGEGPRIVVYDLQSDTAPREFDAGLHSFGSIGEPPFGFSPDGRWLLFLGANNKINVLDVNNSEPPIVVDVGDMNSISSLSVVP